MSFKHKKDYFRETLKDYLTLSKPERKGLYAVILVLITIIIIKIAIHKKPDNVTPQESAKYDHALAALTAHSDSATVVRTTAAVNLKTKAALFYFNPNGLSVDDWKKLGFTERQIRVIKHYEEKGGKFYTKADVKKMYSISAADYERIEPYISIPERKQSFPQAHASNNWYEGFKVDIGTADTTEIKKLRGIGTVFANRIVKYRTKLGGYHSINQLHEIWGMSDSLFNAIADHVYVADTNKITRININAASFNDLKSQPYFNYNLINVLINYRKQHGNFSAVSDLKRVPLVDDSIYRKIAPYLKVND